MHFNGWFFKAHCEDKPESSWFLKTWVEEHCPDSMGFSKCELADSRDKQAVCDDNSEICEASPFTAEACCPVESLCTAAFDQWSENAYYDTAALAACPYHQCRLGALQYIRGELDPGLALAHTVSYVVSAIIFLTCLLICYRPGDGTQEELIKTGVVVAKTKGEVQGLAARAKKKFGRVKKVTTKDDKEVSVREDREGGKSHRL